MSSHILFPEWCEEHKGQIKDCPIIKDNLPYDTVVFHFPCADGFAAALLTYVMKQDLTFYGTIHTDLPNLQDKLKDKSVLFIDISPNYEELTTWGLKDYFIIDHHKTTKENLKNVPENKKLFDMNHSACMLVWKYFGFNIDDAPYIIKAVEARDIWDINRVPDCMTFLSGLHLKGYCASCWYELLYDYDNSQKDKIMNNGLILEANRQRAIRYYVKNAVERTFDGLKTWVVNITDPSCISDSGHNLVKGTQDIAMLWRYDMNNKHYKCSMRSDECGPDVSEIAKRHNGGGHKHAAAFTYSGRSIEDLFS